MIRTTSNHTEHHTSGTRMRRRLRIITGIVRSGFLLLLLFAAIDLLAQASGAPEINPETTSSGGEHQEGTFGEVFSTIGETFAEDSVALDSDPAESIWTGFWQVMPADTSLGVHEEWIAEGNGSTGITSTQPNPFASELTIYVRLAQSANVSLVVYDLLGREVVRLIDDQREIGTSRVRWSPEERIDPGNYILRLETDGTVHPARTIQYLPQ